MLFITAQQLLHLVDSPILLFLLHAGKLEFSCRPFPLYPLPSNPLMEQLIFMLESFVPLKELAMKPFQLLHVDKNFFALLLELLYFLLESGIV